LVIYIKIKNFEEIESWKNARNLANDIYRVSSIKNFKNDFNLIDQIRRASISIMSNIAEGFDSGTNKSFINFLNYSYRSASEVQSLLYITRDLNYISENEFKALMNKSQDTKNLIGGFIKYLKSKKS
jgi:four helix bundle protein